MRTTFRSSKEFWDILTLSLASLGFRLSISNLSYDLYHVTMTFDPMMSNATKL